MFGCFAPLAFSSGSGLAAKWADSISATLLKCFLAFEQCKQF